MNCKGEGNKLDELVETINFSKNIVKKIKKVAEVIIDFDSELTKKNYHAVADETKQMIQDFWSTMGIKVNSKGKNVFGMDTKAI